MSNEVVENCKHEKRGLTNHKLTFHQLLVLGLASFKLSGLWTIRG
jgi:hypothetical protein